MPTFLSRPAVPVSGNLEEGRWMLKTNFMGTQGSLQEARAYVTPAYCPASLLPGLSKKSCNATSSTSVYVASLCCQ